MIGLISSIAANVDRQFAEAGLDKVKYSYEWEETFGRELLKEVLRVCDKPLAKGMLPSDHVREYFGIKA